MSLWGAAPRGGVLLISGSRDTLDHVIAVALRALQVDEGQTEIINLREADPRLGSLITALMGLGLLTLAVTALYWWMTRPGEAVVPTANVGEHHERTLDKDEQGNTNG